MFYTYQLYVLSLQHCLSQLLSKQRTYFLNVIMSAVPVRTEYRLPSNRGYHNEEHTAPMGRTQSDQGDYRGTALNNVVMYEDRGQFHNQFSRYASSNYLRYDGIRHSQHTSCCQWPAMPTSRSSNVDANIHQVTAPYQACSTETERSPSPLVALDDTLEIAGLLHNDALAAARVEENIRRNHYECERRKLFQYLIGEMPTTPQDLLGILDAADLVLFDSSLGDRVTWKWSHNDAKFEHQYLGAAATRMTERGVEVQIILSTPQLGGIIFDSQLLLNTWMHEIIHAYCYIFCGERATQHGGHTDGFKRIGRAIDEWTQGRMHLSETKADLKKFSRTPMMRIFRTYRAQADTGCPPLEPRGDNYRIQKKRFPRSPRCVPQPLSAAGLLFDLPGTSLPEPSCSQSRYPPHDPPQNPAPSSHIQNSITVIS